MNQQDQMHPDDKRNLLIFMVLAVVVYFAYDHFILQPKVAAMRAQQEQKAQDVAQFDLINPPVAERPRAEILADRPRLSIETEKLAGTIDLKGARIDDISLRQHFVTKEREKSITVMSPAGSPHPRYAEIGWVAADSSNPVPDKNTQWRLQGMQKSLTPDTPLTLVWNNGKGLTFERTYAIDENYVISVSQRVSNALDRPVTLHPYALIAQRGKPENFEGRSISHEGPIGYIHKELFELKYKKMAEEPAMEQNAVKGWIGITEKYWLTAFLPEQEGDKKFRFIYKPGQGSEGKPLYQVDILGPARTLEPGGEVSETIRVFTGAKEVKLLEKYEKDYGIAHFDLAVDFGMWYFLTKPFFYILDLFFKWTGNFGIAIIMLTFLLRLAVFPLANKSYKSFAGLKKISPQMQELREKYGDDKEKLQAGLVELYQREKVNPAAGCLPILFQIPIFFALYKVLYISIEMRHAPFFGWIQDLSARDPTSVFNLFGLIPWDPPSFLMIGAWPCLMLSGMLLQRCMTPPPQDKMQAQMMAMLPFIMTYILSQFAAGLVIYWTVSNFLSILQQYIIMRRMGVKVKFFQRAKEDKEMEESVKEGPSVHPGIELIEEEVEDALFGDDDEEKKVSPPKPRKKKKKK